MELFRVRKACTCSGSGVVEIILCLKLSIQPRGQNVLVNGRFMEACNVDLGLLDENEDEVEL